MAFTSWLSWLCKKVAASGPWAQMTPISGSATVPCLGWCWLMTALSCHGLAIMQAMRLKTLVWVMAWLVALTGAAATWAYHAWLQRPLPVLAFAQDQVLEVTVPERAGASAVARVLARAGVAVPPRVLSLWFVWSDVAHRLQAGSYEFPAGVTPTQLRRMLVRGEQAMRRVTLP